MNDVVYHFTDTARLPWILESGELQPGRARIGDFPDPDFLWATTDPQGDRTASASVNAFRRGSVLFVRFTLRADDFQPWATIVETCPAWTPKHVQMLEVSAKGKSRPVDWRCRADALPRSSWLAVEVKSYQNPRWRPLPADAYASTVDVGTLGVQIGNRLYCSERVEGPQGQAGYEVAIMLRAA